MKMGRDVNDFVLDSKGHCFFCLDKICAVKHAKKSVLPCSSKYYLHYLSRYLKMDMSKVFNDPRQISSDLLAKIESSRLKVELCEECRCLSERFSEGYRQLEKLELELGSTLRLIHGKLVGADADAKLRLTDSSNTNWDGLLEVLNVLRVEAIQKSSHKLPDHPRVKLQNLSKAKIREKQFSSNNNFRTNHESSNSELGTTGTSTGLVSNHGFETSGGQAGFLSDSDGNYWMDDVDSKLDAQPINQQDSNTGMEDMMDAVYREGPNMTKGTNTTITTNPKTGKRKCNLCPMEFNTYGKAKYHYDKVHLKLRYKCVSCNKLFSQKLNLMRHQRTTQNCLGMESTKTFKCHLCEKSFALKQPLQTHLDGVHFKILKYECSICGNKFKTKVTLSQHRRQAHPTAK